MHDFEFGGKKLSDIGACIVELPHYNIAARDLTFTSIAGRSGDVITDNNRYNNVDLSYKISSIPNAYQTAQEFVYRLSQWLVRTHSYTALCDTYNPGYYRNAVCKTIDSVVNTGGVVSANVTFCCEPFLYSNDGAETLEYELGSYMSTSYTYMTKTTLRNPEAWASAPKIRFIGNGAFTISVIGSASEETVTVSNIESAITIDKSQENVYDDDGTSRNDKLSALQLPNFPTGEFTITMLAVVTDDTAPTVEITPNWRRL